jgi:hypothetical protein
VLCCLALPMGTLQVNVKLLFLFPANRGFLVYM